MTWIHTQEHSVFVASHKEDPKKPQKPSLKQQVAQHFELLQGTFALGSDVWGELCCLHNP